MANIIIKGKHNIGKTRSEQEENMRKEWGGTMDDENLDRLKHIESKLKEETGSTKNFISQVDIDKIRRKL